MEEQTASEEQGSRPGESLEARFTAFQAPLRAVARQALKTRSGVLGIRPTELLNEAYLRLVRRPEGAPERKTSFLAFASTVIRNVLVDHARELAALKRGGAAQRVTLQGLPIAAPAELDVLELNEALQTLARLDPRQARIVELKFFGGLSIDEIAAHLDVSPRTVDGEWALARAWLHRALSP
jgi:RNA polymerase sigma-70 factor (ECF subfamily)